MQDKYVGDIGDFGKFILLNELYMLCNQSSIIGVNWYFTTRVEGTNNDGRHLNYFDTAKQNYENYFACSSTVGPHFMHNLRAIALDESRRKVEEIEKEDNGILPAGQMLFYREPVPYLAETPEKRKAQREEWFEISLNRLNNADILFLDPDNGIEPLIVNNGTSLFTVKKSKKKAIKYVFYSEIERYFSVGKSIIIYNHRDMKPENEYNEKFRYLTGYGCINKCIPTLVRFRRVSVRDYIFLPQKTHLEIFAQLTTKLTSIPLSFLFRSYGIKRGLVNRCVKAFRRPSFPVPLIHAS